MKGVPFRFHFLVKINSAVKRRNIIRPPSVVPITETGSVIHVLVHLLHTCARTVFTRLTREEGEGGVGTTSLTSFLQESIELEDGDG